MNATGAIADIQKTDSDLNNMDFEWEAVVTKQRCNYQNICAEYEIDSIPIKKIHLFKAADFASQHEARENDVDSARKLFNSATLGWENYNLTIDFDVISVDGNHRSMMTNPKNRALLGDQLTICLQEEKKIRKPNLK